MGHGVAFGMGVGGWWPWRTDRGRPAARGARAVALISGSGLGLVVELVSVGEVGRAGLQGLRLDLGIGVGAGVELGLVVDLLSEMVVSGATGRAGFQCRGLDLDVQVVGRQGQGRRAGGLGGGLGPGAGV